MRNAALLTLALAGLAAAGACDRATAPADRTLTADEAKAVAAAIDDASASVVDARSQSGASFSLAAVPGATLDIFTNSASFSVSRPCPLDGSTTVSGEQTLVLDSSAGTATLDMTGSKSHAQCAFSSPQGEKITVDGSVALVAHRTISRDGEASGSQTHQGTLTYTTASGKSGTCEVDLTAEFQASVSSGTATHTVTGTVCGRTVDIASSWTRQG